MKTLAQLLCLSLLGLATGIGLNALSPDPLPLVATAEQFDIEVDEEKSVKSEEILNLWESGEAIFIDARSKENFGEGRIPGALSLPYDSFEEGIPELIDYLPRDQMLVIYCDGSDCHASPIVYEKLLELGFSEEYMKIFNGGWRDWVELGGEIEKDAKDER